MWQQLSLVHECRAYVEGALAALLSAQLSLVQTHADRLTAIVQLYQSLGGGWAASKLAGHKDGA